jgi:hypothetical protein
MMIKFACIEDGDIRVLPLSSVKDMVGTFNGQDEEGITVLTASDGKTYTLDMNIDLVSGCLNYAARYGVIVADLCVDDGQLFNESIEPMIYEKALDETIAHKQER